VSVNAGGGGARAAVDVAFPGPERVDVAGGANSVVAVSWPDENRDYFVVGGGDGFLNLVKYNSTSDFFTTITRFSVGGNVVFLGPWENRVSGGTGVVAATTSPDRVVFIDVVETYPHFSLVQAMDLEEDPGSCAFVGDSLAGPAEVAVSLPGIDRVVVLQENSGIWTRTQVLEVGDDPFSVAGGDLDADGVREMVIAERGALSRSLAVFARNEDGQYTVASRQTVAGTPTHLQTFDIDGDAVPEVGLVCPDSTRVLIYGDLGGGLEELYRIETNVIADRLWLSTLPGDRKSLFASSRVRGLIEVFSFDGTWEQQDAYYPGCRPLNCITCDVNGDGVEDLVSPGGDANLVTVLFGDDEGRFWGFPAFGLTATPGASSLGDFDGDGHQDLVVSGTDRNQLSYFSGLPDGGLSTTAVDQDLDVLVGQMATIDVDADPRLDLAVLDVLGGNIRILEHDGSTGFVELSRFATGSYPDYVISGDLDADGLNDLIVIAQVSDRLEVYFGVGDGVFSGPVEVSIANGADRVLPVQLNGDLWLDLVVTDGVGRVWSVVNLDGRSFGLESWETAGTGAFHLAASDLDGDLDEDIVVANRLENSLSILENDGSGTLIRRIGSRALPSRPDGILCEDINQDGKNDIAINLRNDSNIGVVYSAGDWTYSPVLEYASGADAIGFSTGDFNSDGVPDFLTLDRSLLLGLTMLNVERVLVSVEPEALAVHCLHGGMVAFIVPDRPGPWSLELNAGTGWKLLVDSGQGFAGVLDYYDGGWQLTLSAAEMAELRADGTGTLTLKLTVGEGTQQESLLVPLDPDCIGTGAAGQATLLWSREPWPNPFNPSVTAEFYLATGAEVAVEVYDLVGRRVAILARGSFRAGPHSVTWDGRSNNREAAAGLYLLRISTPAAEVSRKVLLVK